MSVKGHTMPMKKLLISLFMLFAFCPYSVQAQQETVRGNASYYADKFHGRRTASGEIYNKDSMTCAHLKYPFGTILKVRNPQNNKVVYVRVTDRGPYLKSRIVDLSQAAARELDIIRAGFSMVEITPYFPKNIPYRLEETSPLELPELDLLYMPEAVFPEPVWKRDTVNVSEKMKELTSSWTLISN